MLVREAQLHLGTDHPGRLDAPDRSLFERHRFAAATIDEPGACSCEGYLLLGGHVRRAADDGHPLAVAQIDRRQHQLVRVRVRVDGDDLSHRDQPLVPVAAHALDALRLQSRHRKTVSQLLRREGHINVVGEPL